MYGYAASTHKPIEAGLRMHTLIKTYDSSFRQSLEQLLYDYLVLSAHVAKEAPWCYDFNDDEIEEALAFTFADLSKFVPPHGQIFVATIDQELVGTAAIKMIRPEVAELKRMYVKPEFQGRHIGEDLLVKALKTATDFGAKEIFLDSPPPFKSAHNLYRKHGFEDFEEYPEASIPDEVKFDWVWMKKVF
jgi:GNAT superfamily N-acetyltransferase